MVFLADVASFFLLLNISLSAKSNIVLNEQTKKNFVGSKDTCVPISSRNYGEIGKQLIQQPLYGKTLTQIDYIAPSGATNKTRDHFYKRKHTVVFISFSDFKQNSDQRFKRFFSLRSLEDSINLQFNLEVKDLTLLLKVSNCFWILKKST